MGARHVALAFGLIVSVAGIAGCGGGGGGTSPALPNPTDKPGPIGSASPTPKATSSPTPKATSSPTPKPTATPTPKPTPTPTPSPTPSGSTAFVDWPTYGNNNRRTGESSDATITAGNVGTLKLAWTKRNFDFNVQTQPVVAANVPNVSYDGQTHSIVYVGGGSGRVYAFDAFSGAELWRKQLAAGQYDCSADGGGVGPFGVQGTFAIDRANGVVYVPDGVHRIHALSLASGADLWSVNAVASGSDDGFDSDLHEFVHTALTLVGNKLYGGTGSTCDITPWKGRVFEIDVTQRALTNTFLTVFNSAPSGHQSGPYSGGGVWGWGGPSSDGSSLYIGVGNADTADQSGSFVTAPEESSGYGESVVRLSGNLGAADSNFPNLQSNPAADDLDLSGTPVLFQPPGCPALLALQGKQGYLLIYKRGNLGAGPLASFQFSKSSDESHYIGLPAYSSTTGYLYAALATSIGYYGPGMAILQPVNGCTGFSVIAQPAFGGDSFAYGGADPRSSPTLVNDVAFMGTPEGVLWARNAWNGEALWDSHSQWNENGAGDEIRYGPVVTGGWAYVVATDSGTLYALKVNGAATDSASRRSTAAASLLPAARPLPAPPVTYRPPFRKRNAFGKTPVRH